MRPIKLKITAFGPYSETEEIDFLELNEKGLFLITGPTGSGKSTIFDSIVYALYGVGSIDDKKGINFRSHFSKPDLETKVEFVFEIKGYTYTIIRKPPQEIKKMRGTGFKNEGEKAELIYTNKLGEKVVLDRLKEVNVEIEDIVNLNVKQFRQIMMIPQGQFREVITSDTNTREDILRSLFDTNIFIEFQNSLKEEVKNIKENIGNRNLVIKEELKKINKDIDKDHIKNILDEIEIEKNQYKAELEYFEKEKETTQEIIKMKNLEYNEGKVNNKVIEELEENKDKLDVLKKQKSAIIKKEEDLKKINNSKIIYMEEKYYNKLKIETENIEISLIENIESLKKISKEIKESEESYRLKSKEFSEIEESKNELINIKKQEEKKKSLELIEIEKQKTNKKLKEANKKYERLKGEVENKRLEIKNYEKKLKELGDIKLEQEKLKGKKKEISIEKQNAEEIVREKKSIKILEKQFKKMNTTLKELKRDIDKIESNIKIEKAENEELYKKFLSSLANNLSSNLKEGEECPVCGALEHPKKTVKNLEVVDEEDIEKKKSDIEELEIKKEAFIKKLNNNNRERDKIDSNIESSKKNIKKIEDYSKKELNLESIELNLKEIKEEENTLLKKEEEKEYIEKNIAIENKNLEESKNDLEESFKKKTELDKSVLEISTEIEIKKNEILKELNEEVELHQNFELIIGALETRIKSVTEEYEKAKNLQGGLEKKEIQIKSIIKEEEKLYEKKNIECIKQEEDFHNQIMQMEFSSYVEYREYVKRIEDIEKLDYEIKDFYNKKVYLEEVIKENDKKVKDLEKVNLDKLEFKLNLLEEERNNLEEKIYKVKSLYEKYCSIGKYVDEKNKGILELQERYYVVGELSAITNSEIGSRNKKNMSFERYILAMFLEEILKSANTRLKEMTNGRYEVKRKGSLDHKGRAGGLDLEVIDYFTGRARDITTLSGGESFKASLSMALGLSDTVKRQTGGIELDTIFIDEGFGTLDSESIDSAIEVLIDLQSKGRVIGIISHVDKLKESIDSRIEIYPSNKGSKIKINC